jgi:hypothetical protein
LGIRSLKVRGGASIRITDQTDNKKPGGPGFRGGTGIARLIAKV